MDSSEETPLTASFIAASGFLVHDSAQAKEKFVRIYGELLKVEENSYGPDKVLPPGIFSKVLKLTCYLGY